MAKCASCGAQMEGQFCWKCGSAASTSTVVPFTRTGSSQMGLTVNGASALCYLGGFVTGLIFLLLAPYNLEKQVRFHAFQSIFLSVAVALIQVAVTLVAVMLSVVSVTLGVMVSMLHAVVGLGFFLVWVYMMWKSYQGETVVLPVIGDIAADQAGGMPPSTSGTMGKAA